MALATAARPFATPVYGAATYTAPYATQYAPAVTRPAYVYKDIHEPPAGPRGTPYHSIHSGEVEVSVFEAVPISDPKWCTSPLVVLDIARQRQETQPTPFNERPTWEERFVFDGVKVNDHMHISVWDTKKHTVVASGTVSGQTVTSRTPKKFWVTLKDSSSLPVAKLLIAVRDAQGPDHLQAVRRSQSVPAGLVDPERSISRSMVGLSEADAEQYHTRTHTVQVVRAAGLPMVRPNRNNSAYAELRVGRNKQQTSTKQHQGGAVWGDIFHFAARDDAELTIRIIDSTNTQSAMIGTCTILLDDLQHLAGSQMLEVDLVDPDGKPAGTVVLRGAKTRLGGHPNARTSRARSAGSRRISLPTVGDIRPPAPKVRRAAKRRTASAGARPRRAASPRRGTSPVRPIRGAVQVGVDPALNGRYLQSQLYRPLAGGYVTGALPASRVRPVYAPYNPVVVPAPAPAVVTAAYPAYPTYNPAYTLAHSLTRPVQINPTEHAVIVRQ